MFFKLSRKSVRSEKCQSKTPSNAFLTPFDAPTSHHHRLPFPIPLQPVLRNLACPGARCIRINTSGVLLAHEAQGLIANGLRRRPGLALLTQLLLPNAAVPRARRIRIEAGAAVLLALEPVAAQRLGGRPRLALFAFGLALRDGRAGAADVGNVGVLGLAEQAGAAGGLRDLGVGEAAVAFDAEGACGAGSS